MPRSQAPPDYQCPYRRACPHMEGISAQWAFSVFREHWRLEEDGRLLERDNNRLRGELADVTQERDRIKPNSWPCTASSSRRNGQTRRLPQRRKQSTQEERRAHRASAVAKTGSALVDQTVVVAAPVVCPHCACDQLSLPRRSSNRFRRTSSFSPGRWSPASNTTRPFVRSVAGRSMPRHRENCATVRLGQPPRLWASGSITN